MNSDLGLDFVGIPAGELLLTGGRDEDVARGLQEAALIGRGAGETHNGAMLLWSDEGTGYFKKLTAMPKIMCIKQTRAVK